MTNLRKFLLFLLCFLKIVSILTCFNFNFWYSPFPFFFFSSKAVIKFELFVCFISFQSQKPLPTLWSLFFCILLFAIRQTSMMLPKDCRQNIIKISPYLKYFSPDFNCFYFQFQNLCIFFMNAKEHCYLSGLF